MSRVRKRTPLHLDFTHTHLNPAFHHRYLAGLKLRPRSGSYHTHGGWVMENSCGRADSLIHNPRRLHPNEGRERDTSRKEKLQWVHPLKWSERIKLFAGDERAFVVSPVKLLQVTKRAEETNRWGLDPHFHTRFLHLGWTQVRLIHFIFYFWWIYH